ncbi:MAG: Amidophosphoribosyltransferase precursor, partial [Planctomycetota bacterium]
MSELYHECGVAAVYHLPSAPESPLVSDVGIDGASTIMPRMLQDIQNRGQLAAGMTSYNPKRSLLLETHKDIG